MSEKKERPTASPAKGRTLRGKKILITGGTGSFGLRVAVRLAQEAPKAVLIYSRDEKKQWEMQRRFPDFGYIVGDIRDSDRLRSVLRGVDYVFHAAALKQVPSCEEYPVEAMKTNALGAHNLCEAAIERGVECVIALSTDKAVKPINAMGITKAMMEKIIVSQNRQAVPTIFGCVRYGNVMGSRGSVIPLFKELIVRDQALTLTIPTMTRFLLTLDESVDLVLHAIREAQGGEIFVRRAPAATVLDLARAVAAHFSRHGSDHPVEEIGSRPGEKIHEVLVNEYEMQRAVVDDRYFTIFPEYKRVVGNTGYAVGQEYTSENTERVTSLEAIGALLQRMGDVEGYV